MMRGLLLGWRACKSQDPSCLITDRLTNSFHSMIILATIFLNIGHPGLIFDPRNKASGSVVDATPAGTVKDEQYSTSDEIRVSNSAAV